MSARPAKGGGRWVSVPPERLNPWIDGFAARHGPFEADGDDRMVRLAARDGALAALHVPFPPMRPGPPHVTRLAVHALAARRAGVGPVRRRRDAVGVFDGMGAGASPVGARVVLGRS